MWALVAGLILPMAAFVGIAHLAGERAQAAYLHAERLGEPIGDAYVLPEEVLASMPRALHVAIIEAAREGGADVPARGAVHEAWKQLALLAGGRPLVVQLEGIFVLVEERIQPDLVERGLALGEKVVQRIGDAAAYVAARVDEAG